MSVALLATAMTLTLKSNPAAIESPLSMTDVQALTRGESWDIRCNCAFWGGNDDCRADNGGSSCANFNGNGDCRGYDSNCG